MQIGPYTVLEQIASGGQGVVFRAQGPDGRPVALKVLRDRAATGPSARKRFAIEVGALARLRHPHVVSILGAGEHEGCPWLALEFVEGESLQERLRRGGPLPVDEAIELATQLAQALSYVHACGVLHRDLKPDNVLLRQGAALLTDFGLARDEDFAESRLSRTGELMGTPGYWAPEQAHGDKHAIGETTDVYGLGAVLYACLTGRAPVEADSLQAHLEPQRVQQIPAPRVLRSEVPHWLSQLCARCLSEAPRDRPPSVEAVARALLTAGEEGGRPEARGAPPGRALSPTGVALAALAALAATGVVGWVLSREPERVEEPVAERVEEPERVAERVAREPVAREPVAQDPDEDPVEEPVAEPPPGPAATPAPTAVQWLQRGQAKLEAGRFAEALRDLDRALELDPDWAAALTDRGVCKIQLGRFEDAIADFDRSLAQRPDQVVALSSRGFTHAKLGGQAQALRDFDRALELDPGHLPARFNRGMLYASLGDHEAAIADFSRVTEDNPQDAYAWAYLGELKLKLGQNEAALPDLDRALALNPAEAGAWANRGWAKARLGRSAEALVDLNRSLELLPNQVTALTNRATVFAQLERNLDALADFDRVLELDPQRLLAWRNRAALNVKLERYPEAIADYDRALTLDPKDAVALGNRGWLLSRLGRHDAAVRDFDRALALDPQVPGVAEWRAAALRELEK